MLQQDIIFQAMSYLHFLLRLNKTKTMAHEVTITYKKGMQFETDSPTGYTSLIDTSPESGGSNEGLGPKSMMLSCLLYTSPSPRDRQKSRMPSSA